MRVRVSTIKLTGIVKTVLPEELGEKSGFTLEYKTALAVPGQERPTVTKSTREIVLADWCDKGGVAKFHVGDKVTVLGNIGFSKNRTVHVVADKVTVENPLERGREKENGHEI